LKFAGWLAHRKELPPQPWLWTDPWTGRHHPDDPRHPGGSVYFIIRWIEQRGMATYNIGFVCV
jgi:hypothetical protein